MNTHDDGGPAFPTTGGAARPWSGGMSLRDYFAGQALAGSDERIDTTDEATKLATWCYLVADALLAARKGVVQQSDETPKQ